MISSRGQDLLKGIVPDGTCMMEGIVPDNMGMMLAFP